MLRSLSEVLGYEVVATDGAIGKVKDFYFDDEYWFIRYFVIDTGGWLSGRKVLVASYAAENPDWAESVLRYSITKEEIENCPGIKEDEPVSRQYEKKLSNFFGWIPYWEPVGYGSPVIPLPKTSGTIPLPKTTGSDPNLRSVREVLGYRIRGTDGNIGNVKDFIAETDDWTMRYIIVDTRNLPPRKKVIVSADWIKEVSWPGRQVHVDLNVEQIRLSPEFDPGEHVNREYEIVLYDYYGRPKYWENQ